MDAVKDREHEAASQARLDVKSEVARQLIEAMESGNTPWQKPWKSQALMPVNGVSNNGYRGINRILLALQNRSSNVWLTFNQASEKGFKVRKGERGTPIVKVVELERDDKAAEAEDSAQGSGSGSSGGSRGGREGEQRKAFILKRYFVFNAEQIEGYPIQESEPEPSEGLESVERAEAVIDSMKELTGLMIIHGGDKACYMPSLHEIRMPPKKAFSTPYDYWSTLFHEGAHASMHEKCLNRTEAISKKWGDEAYALEELRAEISSCLLAHSTGIAQELGRSDRSGADPFSHHREQHAAYLRSWVKAVKKDPMAVFSAAKDADLICDYMLGLVKRRDALADHREWIADCERAV